MFSFGRYAGVSNQIGFDGLWRREQLAIVVETKTTDVYAIKTATLLNYINDLVSAERILSSDVALGIYVVGRLTPELKQLENTIVAENHIQRLRVISVEGLLSTAELIQDGFISIEEAIGLLRPGAVVVDDTVRLIARLASMSHDEDSPTQDEGSAVRPGQTPPQIATGEPTMVATDQQMSLLTPVSDSEHGTVKQILESLLGRGWYVFGEHTPGRKNLKQGDRICFYGTTRGVVAEAEVASSPERGAVDGVHDPGRFPWRFRVTKVRMFYDDPVIIGPQLRSQLDAFTDKDPARSWAWFVQGTRRVSAHDFLKLTGNSEGESPSGRYGEESSRGRP